MYPAWFFSLSFSRGIEGLLRTIRLVVKLTNQTELRHFLLQKADEIRSAISSTHRMLAIIGDGMEEGSTFTDTFFTEGMQCMHSGTKMYEIDAFIP